MTREPVAPHAAPGVSRRVVSPQLVGRERELEMLLDAVTDPSAVAIVEGEAGIGKTRLVRECLAAPQLRGRRVLVAGCPPLAEPFPLGPVVDGLRRLRQQVDDVRLSALGGALRPWFPEWADDLPPALEGLDDPREKRHRLFRALSELVERLGVEVLVVEDAHWADAATLEWLLMLTASGDLGMSVVVTYRPTDVPEGSLLLRLTGRPPAGMRVTRVGLGLLTLADVGELVASMFGGEEVSEGFAAFLHEATEGLPLALEECVLLLRDRDDIVREGGGWSRRPVEELRVPATVRDSVLERVARLGVAARRVLEAAAVITDPADEAVLAAVSGLADDEEAHRGLAAALASGLLTEASDGRVVFGHVLAAKAVYEAMPGGERRRLHARVGRALEAVEPRPVATLARHFREAGEVEAWCHYAEASADLAVESGDDRTAVTVLLRLLTSVEHPSQRRVRLARKLGEAAFFGAATLGGLAVQVVAVLRAVLDDGECPPGDRGELRLLLGRMLWRVGELTAAFAEFEAAIGDLDHRPDLAAMAMRNLAMPLVPDVPAQRHLQWLDRASELASDQASPSERLAHTRTRASILLTLGEEAGWEAIDDMADAAAAADLGRDGDERLIAIAWLDVAWSTVPWGRYDHTRRYLDLAVEQIQRTHYERQVNAARIVGAHVDWYTGRWQGLGEAAAALADAEETQPLDRLYARQILGVAELATELATGTRAAAVGGLREVADEYVRLGAVEPMTMLASAALGRARLADAPADGPAANTAAEAVRETEPGIAMIEAKSVWLWATDIAPVHLDALIGAGELAQAEALAGRFAAGLGDLDAPAPQAALLVCRAILAEATGDTAGAAGAAGLFAQAAEAWAALPRPYDELLARERQGRCLLAAGDTDTALALLGQTRQRLWDLGARWDAHRIAHLLREHGVEVARPWRGGRRGYGNRLSPRELEVVRLVATGMTNRQVAQALFLSPRTVDRHLRGAMGKLQVSTRTALAAAAAAAGLLAEGAGVEGAGVEGAGVEGADETPGRHHDGRPMNFG